MRLAFVCTLVAGISLTALELPLGPEALAQAVAIGRTGIESQRTEFHRAYRVAIGKAPLDFIDVVTPFRRIVLAAESRLRSGERLFGQREALEMLADQPDKVDLRLELTFHPLNTLLGVPDYTITLVSRRDRKTLAPTRVDRIPRFGPRVDGVSSAPQQVVGTVEPTTQPMLGGAVIAVFDGRLLDRNGEYDVVVGERGQEVARGTVNFSALR